MADQDFKINIVTLADLTGIKLTQQQLDALQTSAAQGNKQAIAALKQLTVAQKEAQAAAAATGLALGTAVGAGVGVLIGTLASQWREFNAEQDRMIEAMIKRQEKMRELGQSIIELQDAEIEERKLGAEPLAQQYNDLGQKLIRLRTEQDATNKQTVEGREEWLKYEKQIKNTESQIDRVTSALEKQANAQDRTAKAAEKAAEANRKAEESFYKGAVTSASPQVQAALRNEAAARAAAGTRDADLYQRSAEQLKASMSQAQREEYEGLTGGGNQQKVIDAINDLKRDLIGIWR